MKSFQPRFRSVIAVLLLCTPLTLAAQEKSVPQQIADVMVQLAGGIHPGLRFTHTKGLVVTGSFTPAPTAKTLSRAAHLQSATVPVTVRFSDGTGIPNIPDNNANTSPKGTAVRFMLPGGAYTDIVANSHNGFFVGTQEDFLAMLKAIAATTDASPHPSPIEAFMGAHPRALKVVIDSKPAAKSFANLAYYGNNALTFIDSAGNKRIGRYQIIPADGIATLDSATAAKQKPDYMFDDLKKRLPHTPIKFKLYVQLPNPGDPTNDGSIVWPDDRKRVELGTITITAVAPDNVDLQKKLTFNPIFLTNGLALANDPFIQLRSAVYALSVAHRH